MRKRISIFGSTGSIGTSTLNVIRNNKEKQIVKETVSNTNLETNSVNKEGDNNNGQN